MDEQQTPAKKRTKKQEAAPQSGSALIPHEPEQQPKALSFVGAALAVITNFEVLGKVKEFMKRPYEKETPGDKVKKLPVTGYDYVKYSYMDREFKDQFPMYDWTMIQKDIVMGWIVYTVKVTDRITGNSQLGSGGARIATFKSAEVLDHRAIVDMGHSDAAALSNALKNAMSRFGICADVYRRLEEDRTPEQEERFDSLYKTLPLSWKVMIEEKWKALGAGYDDFLDTLELKLADYNQKEELKRQRAQTPPKPPQQAQAQTGTQTQPINKPSDGLQAGQRKVEL